MTKKSLNKLLSVILALAICSATVFGCLITANAADVTCYTWSEGSVDESLTTATIDLTLTATDELTNGIVEALFNFSSDEWSLTGAKVTKGACVSGTFAAENYSVIFDGNKVELATTPVDSNVDSESIGLSYVTIELALTFKNGTATQGAKYNVSISEVQIGNSNEWYNDTATAVYGVINAGCDHVYSVSGLTAIEVNTLDGYYVYQNVPCMKCGDINPYQVVPATELKTTLYWDGTVSTVDDLTGSGTQADPYIIDTAADLAYVTSTAHTTETYYKVADGIDAIVLQSETYAADIMALTDYAQTRAYFANNKDTVMPWANGGTFQGTFDGNGVEIYGMYSTNTNGGLFSTVKVSENSSTIKNLTVKNSYVMGANASSALVATAVAGYSYTVAESTATGYIEFEKVVLANNYVFNTWLNNQGNRLGVMLASAATYVNVKMDSCLVYDNHIEGYYKRDEAGNIDTTISMEGGLFGVLSRGHNGINHGYQNGIYSNSIILDCVPYAANQDLMDMVANHAYRPEYFTNIYTNCTSEHTPSTSAWFNWSQYEGKIITLDKANFMGNGAADVVNTLNTTAGSEIWHVDQLGGYPKFEGDVTSIGGTVLYGRGEPVNDYMTTLVNIKAGTETNAEYGSGTEEDPFLIYNANHLRTIVQRFDASLKGSYFKVADGIDAFVLQNKSEAPLETILQTPEAQLTTIFTQQWQNGTDTNNWTNAVNFSGHIDFNGITIYGMYNLGGGLFQYVQGDTTIKNLKIEKSVVKGSSYAGAIVMQSKAPSSDETGSITIENCAVVDSYISCSSTTYGPAAILGYAGNANSVQEDDTTGDLNENGKVDTAYYNGATTIKNCFVSLDSNAFVTEKGTVTGGLIAASGTNAIKISDCLVLGIKPYTTWTGSSTSPHCANAANFSNVYTDQSVSEGVAWNATQDYSNGKITKISASDAEGTNALSLGLDWNVWSYDGNGGYPTPVSDTIPTTSQLNLNLLGANIDYNDDGTFNFNFYYEDKSGGLIDAPVLYVGRVDGDGFTALTGTALTAEQIEATEAFKNAGLTAGTLYYSIKTISAREINDTFLPTAVATNGSSTVWGKSEQISPADYATSIINSDDSTVTDADKLVAAALVNYGTASAEALSITTPGSAVETKIVYADGGISQTAPTKGTGTEADPYIIENASHLRYIAQKSTPDTTYGVYYKVDPTIDILVLQTESYINTVAGSLDAFLALDAEGVKTALSNTSNRITFQSSTSGSTASSYDGFAGNIDFSGVTICGMFNQNGGLIAMVNGGASFKNLTLCNNYITSGWYNGNLIGYLHSGSVATSVTDDSGATTNVYRQVTISNIEIKNCYQTTTGNGWSNTGVLIGSGVNAKNMPLHVSNVITHDNISLGQKSSSDTTMMECALYGALPASYNGDNDGVPNANFNNIVTLDCVPYPFAGGANNQTTKPAYWHNVYTTKLADVMPCSWYQTDWSVYDITQISSADLAIGGAAKTNMPNLDWTNVWYVNTNAYPSPITNGVKVELPGETIYWDGSSYDSTVADNGEAGTADDPIIIDSAEELYYITNKTNYATTTGNYYKVADGIDTMVLQPEGVLDLTKLLSCADSAEVAEYLTSVSGICNWNSDAEQWFNGNFDGNGVTIVGMYSNARSAGLFPTADGGVPDANKEDNTGITIGNFTLRNSYVLANSGQNRAGAIVGGTPGNGYGNKVDGTINFEKCVVANCYVQSSGGNAASGIMLGVTGGEIVHIDSCAVYGSKAYYTSSGALVENALYNGYNARLARDESGAQISGTFVYNTVSNSIILGVRPYALTFTNRVSNARCLTNVYTDQSTNPYTADTYTEANLIAVTADGLIGSGAANVVDALNTTAGEEVWYVGNAIDGMPGFTETSGVPTAYSLDYANVEFDIYNDYGTSTEDFGLYTTSLSLKNNPYLSLSFAFGNLNGVNTKYERDKITVTIKTASKTITTTPPAYVENEYISNVDGWTNKKNAGRYHMYKLDGISIYDLSEPITVTIVYGDTTIVNTVSVEGFGNELETAYKKAPCDYYSTRVEATKALLFYVQALDAKYNA